MKEERRWKHMRGMVNKGWFQEQFERLKYVWTDVVYYR